MTACGGGDGGGREGDAGANFEREGRDESGSVASGAPQTSFVGPADTTLVLNEAGQFLVDEATVQIEDEDDDAATVVVELPTGNTSTTSFSINTGADLPTNDASVPGSPLRGLVVSGEVTKEGLSWSYRYTVPVDVFPADSFARSASAEPQGMASALLRALLRPRLASAQEGPGVEVVAQGVFKEFGKEAMSKLEESLGKEVSEGALTELTDVLLNVFEAVVNSIEFQETMKRIDELRACAMNPTNPLTQRQYEEEPEAQQHVLREIARVEAELRTNMAVRFIGALNSQATGLVSAKWLGFIIGPLTSWVDEGIKQLGEEALAEVERLVTDCDAFVWSGTLTLTMTNDWDDDESSEYQCGSDFSCVRSSSTSETEQVEESWELTGEQVNPDQPLPAAYTLYASYGQEEESYQTARASCAGDERGGLHEVSSSTTYSLRDCIRDW